eukprot:1514284-Prymnesium_polylepis.2
MWYLLFMLARARHTAHTCRAPLESVKLERRLSVRPQRPFMHSRLFVFLSSRPPQGPNSPSLMTAVVNTIPVDVGGRIFPEYGWKMAEMMRGLDTVGVADAEVANMAYEDECGVDDAARAWVNRRVDT